MNIEQFIEKKFNKLTQEQWIEIDNGDIPKGIEQNEIWFIATGWHCLKRSWIGVCQNYIKANNQKEQMVWKNHSVEG